MAEELHKDLTDFMFLRDVSGKLDVMRCLGLWFGKSNDTDIEIARRFGSHVAAALQENVDSQRKGVEFYNTLEPHLPTELHILRTIFDERLRIIQLCGTFPHRDHYYGRPTSAVGKMLMENPKVRFDLPLVAENGTMKFGHDPKKLWLATQRAFDALERIEALTSETARRGSVQAASWLSKKEIAECHETFRAFDKDGNGSFDREELATVLASTGKIYTVEQLQKAMDRISGTVSSKCITFEQFSALLRARPEDTRETIARKRFDMFDANGSGEIELEELKKCIQNMEDLVTSAEIEEMLKVSDKDHNGRVSFEEFLALMPSVLSKEVEPAEVKTRAYDDLLCQVAMPHVS